MAQVFDRQKLLFQKARLRSNFRQISQVFQAKAQVDFRSQIESFQPGCVLEFSETECMDRSCFFKAIRRLFQANQVSFQANQDLLEKVICCLKKLLENQNRIRLKFCLICLKKLLEEPRIRLGKSGDSPPVEDPRRPVAGRGRRSWTTWTAT